VIAALVDIAALRAVAQSIAEDCDRLVDEVGPAAHRAVLDGMTCRIIIGVIDMRNTWPPSVGAEALPPRIKRALDDYALLGLRTGDCLYAVLCNDLRGAFARADPEVTAAMPAIVAYVNSVLPCVCWGSIEAVESWIRKAMS
jgi:hypothetical protein